MKLIGTLCHELRLDEWQIFHLTFQSKFFNLSSWFERLRLAHYFSLAQSAEGDFFMFSVPKASKRALGPVIEPEMRSEGL